MMQKLNRLDQLTGLAKWRKRPTQKQWERNLRLWWLAPVGWILVIGAAELVRIVWRVDIPPIAFLFWGFLLFLSGFHYAERIRQLGQESGIPTLRKPDGDQDGDATV